MTSTRQIEANRRNAQRSTGPTTLEGKANSSFNGLRHGIFSRDVVLPGEDRDAYDTLLAKLYADLRPCGKAEQELVRRCANLWWRMDRAAAFEAGLLNPDWSCDPRARKYHSGGGHIVDAFRVALDATKTLDMLGRYEGRMERALSRALNTLMRLQGERRRAQAKKRGQKHVKKGEKSPEITPKTAPENRAKPHDVSEDKG